MRLFSLSVRMIPFLPGSSLIFLNKSDKALNILDRSGREVNFLENHKIGFNKIICTKRRMNFLLIIIREQNDKRSVARKAQSRYVSSSQKIFQFCNLSKLIKLFLSKFPLSGGQGVGVLSYGNHTDLDIHKFWQCRHLDCFSCRKYIRKIFSIHFINFSETIHISYKYCCLYHIVKTHI